jgi:putative DNA primase/helicase
MHREGCIVSGPSVGSVASELLDAYETVGYKLVKVDPDQKRPTYKNWQHEHIPSTEIRRWVEDGGNVGVQVGEVSDWICAVDLDCAEAVQLAPSFLPDTLKSGKRGAACHYFYRSPGARYISYNDTNNTRLIDLKASVNGAGHQVVVEPSIHPEKGPYKWLKGFNPARIVEISPEQLAKQLRGLAVAVLIERHRPKESGGHDYAMALVGFLLKNGYSFEALSKVLERVWPANKWKHDNISGVLRDTKAKLDADQPIRGGRTLDALVPGLAHRLSCYLGWERPDKRDGRTRYECTDLGNGERFADRHRNDVRYCYQLSSWYYFDGKRWAKDDAGYVMRLAKETARSIFGEAQNAEDGDRAKALGKWALSSQSAARLEAMLKLAESEPTIPVALEDFDADPMLLNCLNGTVDLRTGQLREHRRGDHITKIAPVEYGPRAPAPTFERFLKRIQPSAEVRGFLRRSVGYSITGDVREDVLFFLHGLGANGKSTLTNALLEALGDYGGAAAPDLLLIKRSAHPTELADLLGRRLVVSQEIEHGQRLAESLVKQITGRDQIKARYMRGDFFEFPPTHKVFLAANHKPAVRGTDHAIWRRIKLIPFDVTIPDAEKDTKLPEKLRSELAGVLAWAVRGCVEWQEDGLGEPEEVTKATAEYRDEEDILGRFLEECCIVHKAARVGSATLYKRFKDWCDEAGESANGTNWSQKVFSGELLTRGFEIGRGTSDPFKGRMVVLGVGLTPDLDPPPDKNGGGSSYYKDAQARSTSATAGSTPPPQGGSVEDEGQPSTTEKNAFLRAVLQTPVEEVEGGGGKTTINTRDNKPRVVIGKTPPLPSTLNREPTVERASELLQRPRLERPLWFWRNAPRDDLSQRFKELVAAVAVNAGDRGEWEPWFGPVAEAVEQLGEGG